MTNAELKAKKVAELREIAEQLGIKGMESKKKQDIIDAIAGGNPEKQKPAKEVKIAEPSNEAKAEEKASPAEEKKEN